MNKCIYSWLKKFAREFETGVLFTAQLNHDAALQYFLPFLRTTYQMLFFNIQICLKKAQSSPCTTKLHFRI